MTTGMKPKTIAIFCEYDLDTIEAVIRVLREGGLVALATEWQEALSTMNVDVRFT